MVRGGIRTMKVPPNMVLCHAGRSRPLRSRTGSSLRSRRSLIALVPGADMVFVAADTLVVACEAEPARCRGKYGLQNVSWRPRRTRAVEAPYANCAR